MTKSTADPQTRIRLGAWLTDLVYGTRTGVPITKVLELHIEDFGEFFPLKQLGCWNPVEALESLPEFVSISSDPVTGEKQILPPDISALKTNTDFPADKRGLWRDTNAELEDYNKPLLKPHRGTFQLTFMNHFQLEKSVLLDYFQQEPGFLRANILSGLKRRCFVSYRTEQTALAALENLKGNDALVELDVADDCKMEYYEDQVRKNMEEGTPEMFICMGTFQLSFTTSKFISIRDITSLFSTCGQVAEVCSNFRKIKGRARVFVKYPDKIQAITALRQLRHQFDDLSVANCCKEETPELVIPEGTDGTYSVRFNNRAPTGEIFSKPQIYQMFKQFGEVVGVRTDFKGRTYIKFKRQDEAMAAYQEYHLAQSLPGFGIPEVKGDPNNTTIIKKTKYEVKENDMEIFISNFPAKLGVNKLRKMFTNFREITFREFKVNKTKAFCFAQLPNYNEIKRAVKELHGSIHYNRNLIVRAKVQAIHERIELELLEELTAANGILVTDSRKRNWETTTSEEKVFYDKNPPRHPSNFVSMAYNPSVIYQKA